MIELHETLNSILHFQPIVTLFFCSVGVATVFYYLYSAIGPFINYLGSGGGQITTFWCVVLIVAGGFCSGCQIAGYKEAGIASYVSGIVILFFYWLRKFVKWMHNEKEIS